MEVISVCARSRLTPGLSLPAASQFCPPRLPGGPIIELLTGAFDRPDSVAPTYAVGAESKLGWLDRLSDLPGRSTIENIGQEKAFILREQLTQLPGARVVVRAQRVYPQGPLLSDLIGFVGRIDADEYGEVAQSIDHATFAAAAICHARELAIGVVERVA